MILSLSVVEDQPTSDALAGDITLPEHGQATVPLEHDAHDHERVSFELSVGHTYDPRYSQSVKSRMRTSFEAQHGRIEANSWSKALTGAVALTNRPGLYRCYPVVDVPVYDAADRQVEKCIKLRLANESGKRMLLLLGAFRAFVGAGFAGAQFALIASGLVPVTVPAEEPTRGYFFAAVGFLAGFFERGAQDMLGFGMKSISVVRSASAEAETTA